MLTPSFRRTILLLLLAAVLATPWASAAGPRAAESPSAQAVESAPLDLLGRVWSFLRNAWSKEGCHIDPSGLCSTGTSQPPPQTKEGCNIDPSGQCRP